MQILHVKGEIKSGQKMFMGDGQSIDERYICICLFLSIFLIDFLPHKENMSIKPACWWTVSVLGPYVFYFNVTIFMILAEQSEFSAQYLTSTLGPD